MFEQLSTRLGDSFRKLTDKGTLKESDIQEALAEVKIALIEADVALPTVKFLINKVKKQAVQSKVIKSIQPGQQVIKIVHDEMIALLGGDDDNNNEAFSFKTKPPHIILMVGLQGSGKTTSSVKIAHYCAQKKKKNPLLASLDIYRPAAQEQLKQFADKHDLTTLPIVENQKPLQIAQRAIDVAKLKSHDVVILDSAGRLSIDDMLMQELKDIQKALSIHDILLVADGLSGQDALETAQRFHDELTLNGVMLTRMDSDARAGVALSMRYATNCPIRFLGVGEQIHDYEAFIPKRIAGQILGMGDIVSLVERAQEVMEKEEAERLERKLQKGIFTMNDMAKQYQHMRKMGGMGEIMGMLPGMNAYKNQLSKASIDEKIFIKHEAIISSMTKLERKKPEVIQSSRKKRIAKGAGVEVQDVNKLLKQHLMMSKMVKKTAKIGTKNMARNLGAMMGGQGNFLNLK